MSSLLKYSFLYLILLLSLQNKAISQKLEIQNFERVTIVTDRDLYLSGEPIWVNALYSIPSDTSLMLSKVLYIELFNNDNHLITSQKIVVGKGIISAKLTIPEHAQSGYYILRAYTRYQENFPTWEMASAILTIVNPAHPIPPTVLIPKEEQITASSMLDGNIAFRIDEPIIQEVKSVDLYINEKPVNIEGKYYANGLGRFNYNPKPTDKLNLMIHLKSGDTLRSRDLPINSHPFDLTIKHESDGLELNFRDVSFQDKDLQISLENISDHQSTTKQLNIINGRGVIRFPFSKIGRGLILITINSNNGNPVYNTFCNVAQNIEPVKSITTDSLFISNEQISIDLSNVNSTDYPIVVSMTMQGTHSSETNLLPNYLIDNPLYIDEFLTNNLQSENDITDQITIALALAHKKLFPLFNEAYSNPDFIVPEIVGLTLQGKLINSSNNEPRKDELIYCSLLGTEPQFHATRSSEDGNFVFPLNFLINKKDIYLVTSPTEENNTEIQVNNGFCSEPPIWFSSPFRMDSSYKELITQMYINYQVNKMFNVNRQQIKEYTIPFRPIFGDNLTVIKLADYVQMSTTPEVFNELVPFVRARQKDGHYKLIVLDDQLNIRYDNPLLLVNQVPYYNIDKLMELQPTEIERIDVSNHVYIYGNNEFNGIIMVTTNTGNFADLPLSQGGVFVEYETLEPEIQFKQFSLLADTLDNPDFANTVYLKSLNNKIVHNNLIINAPAGIADYELMLYSLNKVTKIIGMKQIRVRKGLRDN